MYERKLDFVLRILASQIRSWWWWQDNNIIPVIYYTIVCVYSYNNIITVPRCAVQTGPLFTKSYAEIFNHSKKFNIATRPSSATVRPLFPRGGVSLYFLKKSSKREFSLFFFLSLPFFFEWFIICPKEPDSVYTSRLRLWHIMYIYNVYIFDTLYAHAPSTSVYNAVIHTHQST